jgi:hypothetical protein
MTGMKDPDASPEDMTPEEQQREQAATEAAQLQQRGLIAKIAADEGKANKLIAEANSIMTRVEAEKAKLVGTKVDTAGRALTVAADSLALPPAAAHVADAILEEAGYETPNAPAPAPAPPQPQQPQIPQSPAAAQPPAGV